MALGFSIVDWCAYSPRLDSACDSRLLDDDIALNVSFLPPMSRRRLSKLSKLCLRLAHEVAADYQGYCVFGSQHGELVTTQGLLESIVGGDLVSPAGFSASVHNTAVGLHSINNKNTYPCISLAAGLDTLTSCFIEASAILEQQAVDNVLVVVADDKVPEGLAQYLDINERRGFAALVSKAGQGNEVYLEQSNINRIDKNLEPVEQLATFLLTGESGTCDLAGEVCDWQWRYDVK